MKAVIIAGGEGTRLRPLTYLKPKPLLPVLGVPMIERQIKKLNDSGVKDIIINVGYRADAFERYFKGRENITLSYETTPLGTAGAVKLAEPLFQDCEDIIVLNADILTSFDYHNLISYHRLAHNDVTLFGVEVQDPSRFGLILADSRTRNVEAFLEKIPLESAKQYTDKFYINGGVYIMKPKLFKYFDSGKTLSFEKEVFPTLIMKKYVVRQLGFNGYWIDVGTKQSYLKANIDAIWEPNL